ncbi:MAG: hypothetical protein HZB92_07525 [Euryarchaeota archaeon]|nr:hypothetical protein [Euryarchaeota archaeon]
MSNCVELKVIVSTIEGRGKAKLNGDAFAELQLSQGDRISVSYAEQSIVVEAYRDPIYVAGGIRLMARDAAALGAGEGSTVNTYDGEVVVRPKPAPSPKGRKKR